MGIANRDIKLDNILLHGRDSRPVVKICDFGYSKDEVAGSICKTACGTPEYMAPEVRNRCSWICKPCRQAQAVLSTIKLVASLSCISALPNSMACHCRC